MSERVKVSKCMCVYKRKRERERERSKRGERKNNSSIACYRELLHSKKLDEGKLFITSLKGTVYI